MLLVVGSDKEQKLQAHVLLYSYIQMKTNYLTKRKGKFKFITKNITIPGQFMYTGSRSQRQ